MKRFPSLIFQGDLPVKSIKNILKLQMQLFQIGGLYILVEYTVEPPISDHPRCKDLVVAYGRWSLTRIEPQGSSSEKMYRHTYFMENNLLHAISKLQHV